MSCQKGQEGWDIPDNHQEDQDIHQHSQGGGLQVLVGLEILVVLRGQEMDQKEDWN